MEMDAIEYLQEIDEKSEAICNLSDRIWEYAETAFTEFQSVAALTDFLEREGFRVKQGAYGIETAFTAEYGNGSPRIGFLGEFDALSGMSQTAGLVEKEEVRAGGNGHGCGHNLLGAGSVAAALAVKKYLMDGHQGTVIFYGCPGEEGGSGKAFMARAGAFKDLDVALTWHPMSLNGVAKDSSLANFQILYTFKGRSSHAAASPEMGRSALDALELMNVGTNFLREHMPDKARIHYAITNTGGYSPNVVQSHASAIYLVRAPKMSQAYDLYQRVNKIAEGAALMTETEVEYQLIKSCANIVPNRVLEKVLYEAFGQVKAPEYTEAEYQQAAAYTKTALSGADQLYDARIEDYLLEDNRSYLRTRKERRIYDFVMPYEEMHLALVTASSTDVADVSWQCPTAQIYTATWAPLIPAHSWQAVSQGKSSQAHKGLLYAGKVMAQAAMNLMEHPEKIIAAKKEWQETLKDQHYIPIPDDVKPQALTDIN